MSRISHEQLQEIIARPGYRIHSSVGGLPGAEPQPVSRSEQVGVQGREKARQAGLGKVPARPAYRVTLTLFRCNFIDPDNAFVKPLVDQLRYHRLIPNDDPETIELTVRQRKVAHRRDEGTGIEILNMAITT